MLDLFFKMIGGGAGKSLQSRADSKSATSQKSGITLIDHNSGASTRLDRASAAAARRQEVKARVKKSKMVQKAAKPKAKAVAKPAAKPVVKAKSPSKATKVKASVKPAKTPSKSAKASKPIAKPVKSVGKPLAKPAKSTSQSTTAKSKPSAKVLAKPVKKPVVKGKVIEKVVAKKLSSKVKTPLASAKKSTKVAKSDKATGAKAKPVTSPSAPPASKPKSKTTPPVSNKSQPTVVTVPIKAVAPPASPKVTKAGSRVVPSYAPLPADMSPHGGNTAAKASFTMSAPVLAPPPQLVVKKDPKLANNWKTKSAEQLSDAEVIAMPDSEYMNAKQLAFFRLKLVALKQGILDSAGETTEHLREDTSIVPDPADRATIEEEHALELRTRDRERKLLKKIEQSISSIDADEYGYCDETGEPIGVARLIARPTATLSLEAQQRRELKQKMFGD